MPYFLDSWIAHIFRSLADFVASQVVLVVKNLPVNAGGIETWVRSLGKEGPLEEGMAAHSSILAWRISWTEDPGGLQSMGLQRVGHNWVTNTVERQREELRPWQRL